MSLTFKPYLNQDFEKLKTQHLKLNKLFIDDQFPANNKSLYRFSKKSENTFWKRPHEICDNPQFVVNNIEPGVSIKLIIYPFNFNQIDSIQD